MYAQIVAKYPNRDEAKDARYQRLINIYNSNPGALVAEVDQFLASNPTAERADQAPGTTMPRSASHLPGSVGLPVMPPRSIWKCR